MAQAQGRVAGWWRFGLAALVAVLVVAGAFFISGGTFGSSDCSPEARRAALHDDVSLVLAGARNTNWSLEREIARAEACES